MEVGVVYPPAGFSYLRVYTYSDDGIRYLAIPHRARDIDGGLDSHQRVATPFEEARPTPSANG
jgi:hypothetical protein